jgi:hypothetical protein
LLQTCRRGYPRCSFSRNHSPSVYQQRHNLSDNKLNSIMRPAVSLLYTTTVLSTLGQAFGLWSHSKPLSLQERASIWGLPDCASTCVTSSFGGCNSIDVECICKNKEFLDNLGCCMSKACSTKDQDGKQCPLTCCCSRTNINQLPSALQTTSVRPTKLAISLLLRHANLQMQPRVLMRRLHLLLRSILLLRLPCCRP